MTHLLDADVLIARTVHGHVHHERAATWLSRAGTVVVSPVVAGAVVRFLVRTGESGSTAGPLVQRLRDAPSSESWVDGLSYADVDLAHVTGHRQVTDSSLVALARSRSGTLATVDEGLAEAHPEVAELVV